MRKWFIPVIAAIIGAAISVVFYSELPAEMAIHFSGDDSPDRFASKPFGAFLAPVLILLVTGFTTIMANLEKDENKRMRIGSTNTTVNAVVSILILAVHIYTIAYNLGHVISTSLFVLPAVGLLFILVGNVIPQAPQSTYRFPKLPDHVYPKYARRVGRLMVIIGFVLIVAALLPKPYLWIVFAASIAVFVIYSIGLMFRYSRT